jgi:cobalamin-dependent methionine synthase I
MKIIVDKIPVKGIFHAKVYRSGILIEEYEEHNLVVNGSRTEMAHAVAGDTDHRITKIAFGTNGAEPESSDTVITNQYVKSISGFSFPAIDRVQFDWELMESEDNGMAILEFGLLTANGTLFARKTRTLPIYKADDIRIEGHWAIVFLL